MHSAGPIGTASTTAPQSPRVPTNIGRTEPAAAVRQVPLEEKLAHADLREKQRASRVMKKMITSTDNAATG